MELVDHLFFRDAVRGFADELHERVDVARPLVEDVGGVLLLAEVHDALQTVHLRLNSLVDDEVGQELLRFLKRAQFMTTIGLRAGCNNATLTASVRSSRFAILLM